MHSTEPKAREDLKQRLWGVKAAAKYLGISDDTLRKRADLGEIPVYNDHGCRKFKLEHLEAVADSLPLWNDAADTMNLTLAAKEITS